MGRWTDSFDTAPPERIREGLRLPLALRDLAWALRAEGGPDPLDPEIANATRTASALIVVERRRLQQSVPPKWREKRHLPEEPSLIGAIGSLSLAISAQQHIPGDDLRTMHVVRYLRGAEMHLRELWKENPR